MQTRYLQLPSFWMVPDGKGHWLSSGTCTMYSARLDMILSTPMGALNDLASVPWFFRRVFPVNGPHRPAASNHDYRYRCKGRLGDGTILTRKQTDLLFLDEMLMPRYLFWEALPDAARLFLDRQGFESVFDTDEPLVNVHVAHAMYAGVRLGGWVFWPDP